MIVLDTSALMAIVLDEPAAADCARILEAERGLVMSAVTWAEALIVAGRRGVAPDLERLIDGLVVEVVPVTASSAHSAADAYAKYGKGAHPASLNFADCFSYSLAKERNCPLLYIGNDFSKTDILPARIQDQDLDVEP